MKQPHATTALPDAAIPPAAMPEAPAAPGNQVDLAYEQIEDMIVLLKLAPGARVTEAMLAQHLGIGRTPIREALLRLASDELLIWQPRRGMVVREINFSMQMKVFEARRAIETVLVTAAARRRTRAEAERMTAIIARFRALLDSGDQDEIMRLDRHYVRLLLELSRNPFLSQIIPLYSLSSRFWHAHHDLYRSRYQYGTLTDFHIRIGEAVAEGDEALARSRVDEFMEYIEEFTVYVGKELSDREH